VVPDIYRKKKEKSTGKETQRNIKYDRGKKIGKAERNKEKRNASLW
jgi:hypothetical protein